MSVESRGYRAASRPALESLFLLVVGALLLSCAPSSPRDDMGSDWPMYGGDAGSRQFSPLRQISRDNVQRLAQVWTYHSAPGFDLPKGSELQVNPVVIDGVLYGISPQYHLFALNGANGEPIWKVDPAQHLSKLGHESTSTVESRKRGVTFKRGEAGDRIFFGVNHLLMAIDARTGEAIEAFGTRGVVDLREGLGRPLEEVGILANTPGVLYRDLLIMGTRVSEHEGASPGHIRAYDTTTGEVAWTFHTIPQPGEAGHDTWPEDGWKRFGGANAWAGLSVDHARGLVFAPLGSPSSDFVGVRRPGKNLYGNSLVALDASSGELVWHYQIVHHDLWDRDLNSIPTLVRVRRDGRTVDAVAQTTKQGYVFVFDRESGEPLFPIEEVPVPPSEVPGERSWPTQPIPSAPPPFARQGFSEEEVTDISAESRAAVLREYRSLLPPSPFAPLGPEARIVMPGFDGGATWGGPAFSPAHELLVVNAMEPPGIGQVVPIAGGGHPGSEIYHIACAGCHMPNRLGSADEAPALLRLASRYDAESLRIVISRGRGRMVGMPLHEAMMGPLVDFLLTDPAGETEPATASSEYGFAGYLRFTDPEGYPAIKPPWGTLSAIDLNEGTIVWQSILGEHAELSARGIPPTGTLNYGGPVVTASGLVFIAATMDSRIRAFDVTTGEQVWSAPLPTSAYSTPAIYAINGRQYVAVACGGGKLGVASSDAYVAFALPE